MVTVRPLRFWSPSGRVSSSEKGVWAAVVLRVETALEAGLKGPGGTRAGAPGPVSAVIGPDFSSKYWVEVCLGRKESQGVKVLFTG